jgi:6,7-dimethyl-8-ribityllumazine synthase
MPTIEGDLTPPTGRFAIVAARFNAFVCDALVAGALDGLKGCGVSEDKVDLVRVPGSFEVPLVAKQLAARGRHDAVICLGAVIRGDTDHYDFVAGAAAEGILRAGLDTGVPVIFGVLTCDDEAQALNRAGKGPGNKGYEAAHVAVEMVNLLKKL